MKSVLVFIIGLFTLHTGMASGASKTHCDLPEPNAEIDAVARWAEEVGDVLGNIDMRKRVSGDMETSFGTLIDKSCWMKRSPSEYRKWLDRLESALAHAMVRSKQCENIFHIPELSGVIVKLRRVRISCAELPGAAMGASMGTLLTSPSLTRDYELGAWGKHTDNYGLDDLAMAITHESLHWSVNNRQWHQDVKGSEARKKYGCQDSLFNDRVYLVAAACFPESYTGTWFYNSAWECPGVCESAFTEVEPKPLGWTIDTFSQGADRTYAKKLTQTEASLICEKIRSMRRGYLNTEADRNRILGRIIKVDRYLRKNGIRAKSGASGLDLRIGRYVELALEAYGPRANMSDIKKRLKEESAKLKEHISEVCAKPNQMKEFCDLKQNPVEAMTAFIEETINKLTGDEYLLYSHPALKTAPHPIYSSPKRR